jgi:ribosomal protein L33
MRSIFRLANLIPLQCTNCWQHFYWLKSERGFEAHAKLHDWRG